jgi:hypothetical protein
LAIGGVHHVAQEGPIESRICKQLIDAMIPDLIASYARPGGNVTGMGRSRSVDIGGRTTGRPASLAVDQIRIRDQPANGQGAWP